MMHLTSTRHQGTPIRFQPATTLTKRTSGSGCHRLQGLQYRLQPTGVFATESDGTSIRTDKLGFEFADTFLRIKAISDGNL